MPTHEQEERFLRDLDNLTDEQYRRFRRIVQRFAEDLDRGGAIRGSLRVKPMVDHPGIWEGENGRATFAYGLKRIPGKHHVIWRRIGGHEIFREP
jgi:hypothetical protein